MTTQVRDAESERRDLTEKYIKDGRYAGFESRASGLNHLAFVTNDLDATIDFYTQVVGLKLLRVRPLDGDSRSTMVFFDMGKQEFLAFLRLNDISRAAQMGVGGVHHFALNVDRDQYAEFERRVRERGIEYKTISHEILDSISAVDPNGLEVELSVWNIEPEEMSQK